MPNITTLATATPAVTDTVAGIKDNAVKRFSIQDLINSVATITPSSGTLAVAGALETSGAFTVSALGTGVIINGNSIRIDTASTPASSGAAGTTGTIHWDENYVYVRTAAGGWKRTAISAW